MLSAPAARGSWLRAVVAGGLLTLLEACAGLPPKPPAPQLPANAPLAAASDTARASDALAPWPQREWWHGFGDDTLDALIAQALAQAPDLDAASARIAAARATVEGAAAARRVQVDASASAAQNRLSDNGLFPPQFLGFNWYSLFDAGVNATYSFDWWGRHRAEIAAAVDARRAAEAEREAAALGIATAVAVEYYGWQADGARRALAERNRLAAEQRAQIVAARVAAQIERSEAQRNADLALLAARDRQNELDTALQMHRLALAALLSCAPAQLPELHAAELPQLNGGLPEGASIDLMARRPEIAASRWRVEAAARNVEVARSSFLPDFSLRAFAGLSSREIGRLVESGSAAPTIAAAVHLPLFDGGALRAGYAHSQAMLDAAVAAYRAAIVSAARDVNEQLAARAGWEQQERLREQQLAAAEQLRSTVALRAAAGLSDQRPALEATQQWLELSAAQVQTRYARICAELALIRALGGGYRMDSKQ
jgi:outer membrane protein, multidrug efflux system